ncbi:hypothetical protein ACHAP5_010716 [Fusarium lateritium]
MPKRISAANTERSVITTPPMPKAGMLMTTQLKCSRTEPCGNCHEAGKPCEYRELDKKRRPVSAKYVAELEDRVAYLESLITKIREAAPQDRDSLLDIPEFADHLQNDPSKEFQVQSSPEVISPHSDNLEPDPEGSLIYHGPTSIIHGKLRQPISIAGSAPRYDMPLIQPSPDPTQS